MKITDYLESVLKKNEQVSLPFRISELLDKRFIDKEELEEKINYYFFELLKLNPNKRYVDNNSIIYLKNDIIKLINKLKEKEE